MNDNRLIKHLALYLRISIDKKDENVETLKNHREILTEYAKSQGYTFVEYGEVISGGKTEIDDRVQLKKLLEDIEQYDAILVMELSRLSRNGLVSQTVKQYCVDYDKPIITPYQTYDLANSENDRLMFDVGSMISSHEHSIIGKRSKLNKIQMVKSGLHVTGNVPYGYIRNPKTKKLEIDEEAAKVIRYIFKLHSQGLGSYRIRDILNEEGYKPAKADYFNLPSIKRIIRNPHYKGWTVMNDRKKVKKNGKFVYINVDTITVKNTHPAIIPEDEWDRANKDRETRILKAKSVRDKPAVKTGVTMLKDLIYCGCCSRKLEVRKDHKSVTGYVIRTCDNLLLETGKRCNNAGIRLVYVEEKFIEKLSILKNEIIDKIEILEQQGVNNVEEEYLQRIEHLKKQLKEIDEQDKRLIDLATEGLFSIEQIKEKKQEIVNNRQYLNEQLDKVEFDMKNLVTEDKIKELNTIVEKIDKVKNASPEHANELLKSFVKRVNYRRPVPEHLKDYHSNTKERRSLRADVEVEFYDV